MKLPFHTRRRLSHLGKGDPLDLSLVSGLAATLWGIWVLYPTTTFTTASFQTMRHWAPESIWGVGVFSVGLAQILFALFSTRWLDRLLINGFSCLMWSFIALAFGLSNVASTGVPIYSLLALVALGAYIRRVGGKGHDES